jgi:hypothetical protein
MPKETTYAQVNKSSLSRVWRDSQRAGHTSFGIVSADRASNTPKANTIAHDQLQHHLRSQGYGFAKLVGHWHETGPDGSKTHVTEHVLFVPGLTLKRALRIRAKFNQDAIVHAGPESGGKVVLHHHNVDEFVLGGFDPEKLAAAYSSLRGKNFTCKGFERLPDHWAEGVSVAHRPKLFISDALTSKRGKF